MPGAKHSACPRHPKPRLPDAQGAVRKAAPSVCYSASSASTSAAPETLLDPSNLVLSRVRVDCRDVAQVSKGPRGGGGGSKVVGARSDGDEQGGLANRRRNIGWWRARLLVCVLYLAVILGLIIYIEAARVVMVPITVFLIVLSLALFVIILFCVCFVVFL